MAKSQQHIAINKYVGNGQIGFVAGSLLSKFDTSNWWNADARIEFDKSNSSFHLFLSYDGIPYEAMGKLVGPNAYSGILISLKEQVGEIYFWVYTNDKGCSIHGNWN